MALQVAVATLIVLALGGWLWGRLSLLRRLMSGMTCPQCGEHQWQRVHRHLSDRVFGVGLGIKRFRCLECRWEGLHRTHG